MLKFKKKIFCTTLLHFFSFLRFCLPWVWQYYEKTLKLPISKSKFNFVSEETVLKILKYMDESKAVGLDNLSAKFLKME